MAETRETQVLEDVINETEIDNPRTTEEAILAQVVAGEEVTINARTRLQKYLSQLTRGGSSVEIESLTATENKTYTAPSGKAYTPVTVNVPNPNSIQTINGNLTNLGLPSATGQSIKNNNATLYLDIDGTAIGMGVVTGIPTTATIEGEIRASFASIVSGTLIAAMYAKFGSGGSVVEAYVYSPSNGVVDVASYPLPTVSHLTSHPLS